ncbi:fibronectin type III domain-containing protein [Cytobacillus solani]|uniref:fibronectin type III domain-containing protein n=1 Tax=Cytobacillus solani TaxID=1637975 RepID=UPI002079CEFD|nr:fibronectin type III domain-containing protein [Cytobacillus solani]USK56375.1 fibronectin type III domain-containing protein [Cytobacillus solani]
MRKVVPFLLAIFILVMLSPNKSAFAEAENILSGVKFNIYWSNTGSLAGTTSAITDGNSATGVDIINSRYYTAVLDKSYDATAYQMVVNNTTALGYFKVEFYSDINLKNLIGSVRPSRVVTEINFQKIRAIKIVNSTNSGGYELRELMIFAEPVQIIHDELQNLTYKNTDQTATLNWKSPIENVDFIGVNVYKNGTLQTFLDKNITSFTDKDLKPATDYKYRISAVYTDGFETVGLSQDIKTDPAPLPAGDVTSVTVVEKFDRVNLSWKLPKAENFKSVIIYRDTIKEVSKIESFFIGQKVYAASTPIFETNGTYFNDLSVKPESKYEYTLKTQTEEGVFSDGVTVLANTPSAPLPEIENGGFEESENGDFLFTWTSPTTGKVKVLIDGKEYKIVEASLKQILIPKNDMKYDIFNNPKVTLVPITEDGKEGTPTKPEESGGSGGSGGIGGGNLPFGPTDLLKSIMGLLGVIAPILLLSLAIIFFKPIKNLIVKAIQNNRERKMYR